MEYLEFLRSKQWRYEPSGFEPRPVNNAMFPFQADITSWSIRKGRSAIFADCGLGKTLMELEFGQQVVEQTNRPVLIAAPLSVSQQTKREGLKFGYDVNICRTQSEFFAHFEFIVSELFRILMPGRLLSFHCMDIPAMKERDGYIGLTDFPGDLIRMFQRAGFIYHSRVCIWKDPLIEATRTKAIGLMHKQLVKDSAMCRNGLPDYLITMRKPGDNPEPISHPDGLTEFAGENEPRAPKTKPVMKDSRQHRKESMVELDPTYSHHVWRRYASPVWMDINQSNTLNRTDAREEQDEKHICPLQLDVIERALTLWTNPGDIAFTPFLGIGSEAYQAVKMKRFAIGVELKHIWFQQAVQNCISAEAEDDQVSLFDQEEN